jgi:hypothetical protein
MRYDSAPISAPSLAKFAERTEAVICGSRDAKGVAVTSNGDRGRSKTGSWGQVAAHRRHADDAAVCCSAGSSDARYSSNS